MAIRIPSPLRRLALAGLPLVTALGLLAPAAAHAQAHSHGKGQAHAHVHGEVELGVALEGPAIVIEMRTPLDNLVGFERAPRNDVEKNTVDQTVSRLRAADYLFRIDPAGNCKLGPVTLEAPALGLGAAAASSGQGEHAEMLASFAFNCTAANQVKFIELDLFKAFSRVRQIDAEIVTAEGQHKRSLKRPASRLSWAP
ncbi:MAG: DUF2796 domain-containing protein [Comamonadaceae bacterium]|nr:MAG: DUF2796 domain-containing protein [Comamonadaceae bacterium]